MRRYIAWFRSLNLRSKLMISIVICLILPAIAAGLLSDYWTRDILREQAGIYSRQTLNTTRIHVSDIFSTMLYISNQFQWNEQTRAILKQIGSTPPNVTDYVVKGKSITNLIETMVYSHEGMYLTLLLPNGFHFSNYSLTRQGAASFHEKPWFQKLDDLSYYDTHWMGVHPSYIHRSKARSSSLITLARTLRTEQNQIYAYLIISVEERQIGQFLSNYKNTQELMVIDRNGLIISHADRMLVGTHFPYYEHLQSNETEFLRVGDDEYMLQSEDLIAVDWMIVNYLPYKNAVEKIQQARRTDQWVQLAALAAFILLLLYLIKQFTAPLKTLTQTAFRIESGDLGVRSYLRRNDEVGRLGYVFDRMLDRIEEVIEQIKNEQNQKRIAELKMLQSQINPHFLFNILNSIRMSIYMKGDKESAELISSLSSLLRMTIHRNEIVTLQDEVETIKHYVHLMRLRQKEDIELKLNLASDTLFDEIPRFSLQPIIENSLIHGLKYKGGVVRISTWHDGPILNIEIVDNGCGMEEERLQTLVNEMQKSRVEHHSGLSGIGLSNVYERFKLLYGPLFDMMITSPEHSGTRTLLKIPRQNL